MVTAAGKTECVTCKKEKELFMLVDKVKEIV
jgi:hypothetical protein